MCQANFQELSMWQRVFPSPPPYEVGDRSFHVIDEEPERGGSIRPQSVVQPVFEGDSGAPEPAFLLTTTKEIL